jgi:hypothetical protein
MTRPSRLILGSFLFLAFLASLSHAQGVQRTFVSGLGSDGNPCSRTAPCRTFGQAISQTNAGGEVYVLDSAGYGPFTITKSISIVAPTGLTAGVSVFSADGIAINAGASDGIILRGLTVNNQGSTGNGIIFNTGGTLHIEGCVINGFSGGSGLFFVGAGKLEVKDSIIRGNGHGIAIATLSGTAVAAIEQVRLEGNSNGLYVGDGSKVVARNTVASNNSDSGMEVANGFGGFAQLNIENCLASNNSGVGILATSATTGGVTARVSNSTVTNNGTGLQALSGGALVLFFTRGNNTVEDNGSDTSGPILSYSGK